MLRAPSSVPVVAQSTPACHSTASTAPPIGGGVPVDEILELFGGLHGDPGPALPDKPFGLADKLAQNSVLGIIYLIPDGIRDIFFCVVLGILCSTLKNVNFRY